MSFNGLDFGSGLSNFSNVLEQGYKDRAALQKENDLNARAMMQQQAIAQRQAQEKALDRQLKRELADQRNATLKGAASNRPDLNQKTLQFALQQVLSARGDKAVNQAKMDIYSAKKVDALVNLLGDDPNKLPMPMVRLLAGEVGKIAQGGSPTMHELEGITPNSFQGKASEFASKFLNEPTPANAGAFIKQLQSYSSDLKKVAEGTVQDKVGGVIESLRDGLGEKNYGTLKKQFLDPLINPDIGGGLKNPPPIPPAAHDFAQKMLQSGRTPQEVQAWMQNKFGASAVLPSPQGAPGRQPQSMPQGGQMNTPPNQSFMPQQMPQDSSSQMNPMQMDSFLNSDDSEDGT